MNNSNKKKNLGLYHMGKNLCNCHSETRLDDCGCCEGIKTYTPADIENPPSLSSIKYRIGTHGTFKASMLGNLSRKRKGDSSSSSLSKLTTREDNDLAIAIIDAWATIADVITFYQERIANEGFLRTSTERMSVLELARSIGYELGSGVASNTFLAFMLEENNPSIEKSIIPIGTKVQSIPQQGETPQTFETIEMIEARPEINELKAKTVVPHTIDRNTDTLYFEGVDTKLRQDDMLLIVDKDKDKQNHKFFVQVLDVKIDEKKNVTIVKIMISWSLSFSDVTTNTASTQNVGATTNINSSHIRSGELNSSELSSMAMQTNVNEKELVEDQNKAMEENMKSHAPYVYAFRQKATIFGHDAPSYDAITLGDQQSSLSNWDYEELYIYQKVNILKTHANGPFENYSKEDNKPIIFLDNVYENIIGKNGDKENDSDSWVVFCSTIASKPDSKDAHILVLASQVERTTEETLAEYTVTGKATGIQLKKLNSDQKTALAGFRRRKTTVYIESEKLELAGKIDETPVMGDLVELEKGVVGLKKDQIVIITGEIIDETGKPSGKTGTEYRKLREITTKKVFFDKQLDNKYHRESVKIYANVAIATHGETKREVLGSGDPTISQQSFTLKQRPLTYIKAPTPTGGLSTLEVRVDDILWKEVDYLYDLNPKDRVFVTRNEDDSSTNIIFGDGKRGSKPFIGVENITAKYRIGTGRDGILRENQLSILMDRPLGVKSVTNPFPTDAAEDPENMESARINAPLKVLTMDRIVSIYDFENFARCFAGISKAKASKIWNGTKMIVHLTVASSSGQRLDPLTCENITLSIERFKDPHILFMLDSFIRKTFSLEAKIKVSEDMLSDKVLESVNNVILDTFSFEKRQFAKSVTLSEVLTLIQNVQGVIFVDLDEFRLDDNSNEELQKAKSISTMELKQPAIKENKLERYLPCSPAYYDDKMKKIIPAEILIVNPQGVKLLVVD